MLTPEETWRMFLKELNELPGYMNIDNFERECSTGTVSIQSAIGEFLSGLHMGASCSPKKKERITTLGVILMNLCRTAQFCDKLRKKKAGSKDDKDPRGQGKVAGAASRCPSGLNRPVIPGEMSGAGR